MKLTKVVLGVALVLALSGAGAWGQTQSVAEKPGPESTRTFYLANISRTEDATEILIALRNLLDPRDKVFLVPLQNAIIVRATPEQLELAQRLLKDLDRIKRTYRITYTITETDGGKRIGVQHFTMIVVSGARTTLKEGSRVPFAGGASPSEDKAQTPHVSYIDVGLNLEVSLDEFVDGVRLRSKVEQSSVAEERSGLGTQDPIIRQTVLEGTSILTLGKPLVLGSVDVPGSTRHLDVEVMLEVVR